MSLWLGLFSHFPRIPNRSSFSRSSSSPPSLVTVAALAAASALGLSLAISDSLSSSDPDSSSDSPSPPQHSHWGWAWASLSLSVPNAGCSPVERRTGEVFPEEVDGGRRLLGIGLRKSNVLGLKTINVYAFGVYAADSDLKKLHVGDDEQRISEHALDTDIPMTVRLQIVYGRLGISSVRSAFAKTVGARLRKFAASSQSDSDSDTDQLLARFVSLFKDDQKLPKGSVIQLSREPGHVLRATIDGKELGQIQSKLLCKSVLDLYFGEDPLDQNAKEEIQVNLATRLKTN